MEGSNGQGPRSPLLPVSRPIAVWSQEDLDEGLAEAKRLLTLAVPLVTVNLLVSSLLVISLMFVGHLGQLHLSGASLATSFVSVTGFSLLTGMAGALETFCGQSYGRRQYHMLGIHMQRAMFILVLAGIPLSCVSANTRHILVFLGQDPKLSTEAGEYARYLIPSIFGVALFQCQIRFLEAQKNLLSIIMSAGITVLLHVFTCWLLVFKSGLGSRGAALASSISSWIHVLFLSLYIKISPSCKNTWMGFSSKAFNDLWNFLSLAIPRATVACLEMWPLELMVLLSGFLPNPKLEISVVSISVNAFSLISMLPLGLGSSVSTRVSNELGARKPDNAHLASSTGLFIVIIEAYLASMAIVCWGKFWSYCYSTDEVVVRYAADMLLFVAVVHLLGGLQSVLSGIARGSGRQKLGAITNLGAYLLGISAGVFFAFACHAGGMGLWWGTLLAPSAAATILGTITGRIDWQKEANEAGDSDVY